MSDAAARQSLSPPRRRGTRIAARAIASTAPSLRQGTAADNLDPRVRGDDTSNGSAPASYPSREAGARKVLVIACGALAREVLALKLEGLDVTCLPASLHNRPERIPEAVRGKIRASRAAYDEIVCLYGDCGTGGALDDVLAQEGVARIAGAHCYAFYAGEEAFAALAEEEPGTFYLTDFLAQHFETLVVKGLGLDRFPELRDAYFGAYRRVVHLAQFDDPETDAKARAAAERLGLAFERRFTGLEGISAFFDAARRGSQSPSPPTQPSPSKRGEGVLPGTP
jgi:Protein of unknown function (DUF1638)